MKKVVVMFVSLFVLIFGVYAQHLKFKGIEITGTLDNVVKELKAMGYELEAIESDAAMLSGEFAGEDCDIVVYSTPISKQVYTILVSYEEEDSWYSLKADYLKFKRMFREKYNVIPKSTEEFHSPYYEGDGYEMQALRMSKCFYFSNFNVENGTIKVVILKDHVVLAYIDGFGDSLNEREKETNSFNDL